MYKGVNDRLNRCRKGDCIVVNKVYLIFCIWLADITTLEEVVGEIYKNEHFLREKMGVFTPMKMVPCLWWKDILGIKTGIYKKRVKMACF